MPTNELTAIPVALDCACNSKNTSVVLSPKPIKYPLTDSKSESIFEVETPIPVPANASSVVKSAAAFGLSPITLLKKSIVFAD